MGVPSSEQPNAFVDALRDALPIIPSLCCIKMDHVASHKFRMLAIDLGNFMRSGQFGICLVDTRSIMVITQ